MAREEEQSRGECRSLRERGGIECGDTSTTLAYSLLNELIELAAITAESQEPAIKAAAMAVAWLTLEGFGAADYFEQFLGDAGLTRFVVDERKRLNQFRRVGRCIRHRLHTSGKF